MTKPWTASISPITANEAVIRKAEAINALLVRPIDVLPVKVGDEIRPFALGLWNEIRPLLKPDAGVTALRKATGAYLHSKRYYFASAQPGSMRHNIHGAPVEELSAADRQAAQERYLSLKRADDKPTAHPQPPASKADQIRAGLLARRVSIAKG
ncbi:ProQ/FINO family protein [Rhizobium sp. P32RR-XVIII]|uniref:ProQ/FINO family protein n=1 Tax=Rhizobium sp. P32RR-XVIII TaxID=2726738 RepID=UPI0014574B74|nr:ProQ/FINO family protein [Rhizobium sp. P32RR-XVIII]NLS07384.1 ProQ/FINO family protein [Rhizobium sp. P32RR-XVIII]